MPLSLLVNLCLTNLIMDHDLKYHGYFILQAQVKQLLRKIQQKYNTFKLSVSHTTRKLDQMKLMVLIIL